MLDLSIDAGALARVCGGTTTTPNPTPEPPPRTWGQTAADYAQSCVQMAGTALIFQGRPATWQQAAITAGIGCAAGLATRATQDWADR